MQNFDLSSRFWIMRSRKAEKQKASQISWVRRRSFKAFIVHHMNCSIALCLGKELRRRFWYHLKTFLKTEQSTKHCNKCWREQMSLNLNRVYNSPLLIPLPKNKALQLLFLNLLRECLCMAEWFCFIFTTASKNTANRINKRDTLMLK